MLSDFIAIQCLLKKPTPVRTHPSPLGQGASSSFIEENVVTLIGLEKLIEDAVVKLEAAFRLELAQKRYDRAVAAAG